MEQKIGLFVGGVLVSEYEQHEYKDALEDAMFAYIEADVPHEVKFI